MRNCHIINIAELFMDGSKNSLEMAMKERSNQPLTFTTVAPTPPLTIRRSAKEIIQRTVELIKKVMQEIIKQYGQSQFALTGRSFGGFLALQGAVEMEFENIPWVFSMEAPQHPHVAVAAPPLLPPLRLFGKQYQERAEHAQNAVNLLSQRGTSHVVTIQTQAPDAVVPNQAHTLPDGLLDQITYIDTAQFIRDLQALKPTRGVNVILDSRFGGVREGPSALLPVEYTNHLVWSPEKMAATLDIIEAISSLDLSPTPA